MARWTGYAIAGAVAAGVAGFLGATASCSQTPVNVPVQTFDRPQNVDVVCLQVRTAVNGPAIVPPIPQVQAECAPVATGVDGTTLPNHLFALVTQTTHGEVAVVDLTGGYVVDVNPAVPGINFLPVGELPSDIAVSPDGVMAYVGSASPNKPAIYALPTSLILGAANGATFTSDPSRPATIPSLTTWPVCALPQAPGAITVLPKGATDPSAYSLAVVFPGDSVSPARVAIVDPAPLKRGAGLTDDAGAADAAVATPGSLAPCTITSYTDLAAPAADTTWAPGPTWDDGVKYVDGGVTPDEPIAATSCVTPFDAGGPDAATPLAGVMGAPRAGSAALDLGGPSPILYVADTQLPVVHVLDLADPLHVVERAPLLATSSENPLVPVSVGQIAVSPPTRDYKRFLYAIDRKAGSILLWDVSDPIAGPRTPLQRPHPELEPFQPPDRIRFSAPVASLAFVRHDWPLASYNTGGTPSQPGALSGVLCNPNPNIDVPGTSGGVLNYTDPGGYYRQNAASVVSTQVPLGPGRLRGVFAFVTLSNGNIVTLDVDDWDAPCRRPDPLAAQGTIDGTTNGTPLSPLLLGSFSSIAPPQPPAANGDPDAYHAPLAFKRDFDTDTPVSLEAFFPVSAPHRARSNYLLRNDPTNGNHAPYLLATPQLQQNGAPVATQGDDGLANPSLVPTDTAYVDPSLQLNPTAGDPSSRTFALTLEGDAGPDGGPATTATRAQMTPGATPAVRFSYEDPMGYIDQDWSVVYEGALPGFFDGNGNPTVVANLSSADSFETLTLAAPTAKFCSAGIEDYDLGQQRARSQLAQMNALGLPTPTRLDHRIADYVQVTDALLPQGDPYWGLPNDCWDGLPDDPNAREQICSSTYGDTIDPTNPTKQRDFPIVQAYDGKLLVSRFGYPPNGAPREVAPPDPSNAPHLRLLKCCFHNQVSFNVRTGATWAVIGSTLGFLAHEIPSGPDARCAPSCEARDALLNGRAPMVPRPDASGNVPGFSIDRDSVLAFRNSMFSFLVWDGIDPKTLADQEPGRDMVWHFQSRGQLVNQQINLAATTSALSPQSMRFIDSLGQLAVIDGSSQGLILIDLNSVALAHAPYF